MWYITDVILANAFPVLSLQRKYTYMYWYKIFHLWFRRLLNICWGEVSDWGPTSTAEHSLILFQKWIDNGNSVADLHIFIIRMLRYGRTLELAGFQEP